MQVFELYLRRLVKRKVLVASMVLLPLVAAFVIVQVIQPMNTEQYTHTMNNIVGILLLIALLNPMQIYGDKKSSIDLRIILSTHSAVRYYCQIIAVFLMISLIQLIIALLTVHVMTDAFFPLTVLQHIVITFAYILLTASAIGLGLIIMFYSQSRQSSWIKLITVGLVFVVLGGLLLPYEQFPSFIREACIVLPTNWLTKVVSFILEGSTKHISSLAVYLLCLLMCAVFIILRLTRTKSERI